MKLAAIVLAGVVGMAMTTADAEVRRTDRAAAPGRVYVRLADWARANRFTTQPAGDHLLRLSNRWSRVEFNLNPRQDLRRAWINGVQVWLSFPLVYQNGDFCVSQIDLEGTLKPVLSPPATRVRAPVKTVCLDPGHGGSDPGFTVGASEEKKYTLLLAREVREQLQRAGLKVVLTRDSDVRVPLEERPAFARRKGADLFVSLHFNSIEEGRDQVKGIEVYCCTPAGATSFNAGGEGSTRWSPGNRNDDKNLRLAYLTQKALTSRLPTEDRGVKRARYRVLREATMPAILIEGGFMSHPAEGQRIFDPNYRRQMARAIADGILSYR